MLSFTRPPEARGVVGPLTLSALINCLEARVTVLREAGDMPVKIGGLADLLEQAVHYLQGIDARAVRAVAEARRDYGGQ
jgi:hypothetical protein